MQGQREEGGREDKGRKESEDIGGEGNEVKESLVMGRERRKMRTRRGKAGKPRKREGREIKKRYIIHCKWKIWRSRREQI